jgi:hypothetical protein
MRNRSQQANVGSIEQIDEVARDLSRHGKRACRVACAASSSLTLSYAFKLDTDASWRPAPVNAARIARNTVLAKTTMTVSSNAAMAAAQYGCRPASHEMNTAKTSSPALSDIRQRLW